MPTYAVRAPLVRWLAEEASRAHRDLGRYCVLDVGCGDRPYEPLFAPFSRSYIGVDPAENARADLRGAVEALPVEDDSFEVVVCAQVLEHCDDPVQAVSELHRVAAPGGRVLASTHGAMVYHPDPADLWRWTHAGLERLFRSNGDWASVSVTPASGTTACLGMLFAIYLEHVLRRTPLKPIRGGIVAAVNRAAAAIDGRSATLLEPRPGTIFANYHVVAEK
jgi:SAM-dependent methyltransferase